MDAPGRAAKMPLVSAAARVRPDDFFTSDEWRVLSGRSSWRSWLPLVTRLRNISEHALVAQNEPDPLRHARTTHANWFERMLVAPYWVNYHCEHHMFTQIACWNLPLAHRILKRKGVTAGMEVQPGYLRVLALASST